MSTPSLLFKHEYAINDKIRIHIPTIGEVLDKEEEYYQAVSILTATPIDFMVQLDDVGIDYETLTSYELFLILFSSLQTLDTSLIFVNLDLSKFKMAIRESNHTTVLIDTENDIVIDEAIHARVASVLRTINHIEKNRRKAGNEEAKRYLLERARIKAKRRRGKSHESQLEHLIVALVNTEQYKYNYRTTEELTIYQFNESVLQIIKKVDYEHLMHGIYAGTISAKSIKPDKLNWLTHK